MVIAVIFDLDGVIIDSEHIHIEAEKRVMLRYGVRLSLEELHGYTGTTAKFMFAELIKKYRVNTTLERILSEKEEVLFRLFEQDMRPTKGVNELLTNLKQYDIKLGIASSSPKRLIMYALKRLNVTHFFDSIVSSDDIQCSKPNPEIFLRSASHLDVSPALCIVVEDAELGVEAAKNAGMRCIGYKNPHSGDQDLSKADLIIDDFSKLTIHKLLSLVHKGLPAKT